MGTGGHVIWDGKPLTSGKKGSWAQGTGSHVIWGGKTADWREKGIAGWVDGKPLTRREKLGAPISQKKTPCWKNKNDLIPDFSLGVTNGNVDPNGPASPEIESKVQSRHRGRVTCINKNAGSVHQGEGVSWQAAWYP